MADAALLARRLRTFRDARAAAGSPAAAAPATRRQERSAALAEQLAAAVGGECIRTPSGSLVRIEPPATRLAIDRAALAGLPGQPPDGVPLVCLDTETTGLATAAGTLAFLVGLGRWEDDRFRRVLLLLPDHADEPALLDALGAAIPPDAWLVTYNGRGFDWPLLVARYRLARREPPALAGHLDLLGHVRRLFRHRLADARLETVERNVLELRRRTDVASWEIPSRYFDVLGGGSPELLVDVVRHNDEDVRSLGRLLAHLAETLGDPERRRTAPAGDLAGLARGLARQRRLEEAVACYDDALARDMSEPAPGPRLAAHDGATLGPADEPWWSPRLPADFGGSLPRAARPPPWASTVQRTPWTAERIAGERARLLARLGRAVEAELAWRAIAVGTTRAALLAWVEVAKLREHRLADPAGAMAAVERALALSDRRRRLGLPEPRIEADIAHRAVRLRRRLARRARAA